MSSRPNRIFGTVLIVTAAFLLSTGRLHAHPRLIGTWVGQDPPNTLLKYDLGPGEYHGNWVWRGPLTFYVDNCAVSTGTYELRMFNGLEGTIELRDGNGLPNAVGTIDLGRRTLIFKSVVFRP